MENFIEFRNTNFAYDSLNAFNDFNMEIKKGDIVTLIGPSGSGKTTLLRMLCNRLPNNSIYFKGQNIKSYSIDELKKGIVVVFDEPLITKNPIEELKYYLTKLQTPEEEIETRITEFKNIFGLYNFAEMSFKEMTYEDRYLIKILRFLIIKPEFIAIDNILSNLTKTNRKKITEFIKNNKLTLLNVTTNLEDALLGNKLYVLENFVLILEGTTLSILKTDTILKRLGFSLPLSVDLSIELNHYEILDKIYTDQKKLVNELWK